MIDPNLEGPHSHSSAAPSGADRNAEMLAGIQEHAQSKNVNETDTKLAHALQGFSDGQGQVHGGEVQG